MPVDTPSTDALAAILGPATRNIRRAAIYEEDGATLWKSATEVPLVDGSVSVDQGRDERRSLDLIIDSDDGAIRHATGQLWYDKIIKVYRGVEYGNGQEWVVQVGEFMIDQISSQDFPNTIQITGRDYTKKLLASKFKLPTSFAQGQPIEDVIKAIATNGGISQTKMILPQTGQTTGKEWFFESGVERWRAMNDIAVNYGWELYFDAAGFLIMSRFKDPVTTPAEFTFETGEMGSLVSYKKSTRDSRLYNVVVVTGEAADTIPVYGIAENHEPGSPTSVEEIGERVYRYTSSFVTTNEQAEEVARNFLAIHALEEYDVSLESIVFPWLEAGSVVEFIDPDPDPGDPTRFLLSSFSIPLMLGSMSSQAKRVVRVQ